MFWLRFESRLAIEESDDNGLDDGQRVHEPLRETRPRSSKTPKRTEPASGPRV
jgi:hypothetical protein